MAERTITNRAGRVLTVLNSTVQPSPDLSSLHQIMQRESALLPTSVATMQQKYELGHAIILTNEAGDPVGYLGFTPLIDEDAKRSLGLPDDFPNVWEIGSAIVHPSYRGGVYRAFRSAALELVLKEMKEKRMLILGTTKVDSVLHTNRHAPEDLGITFTQLVHTDLDAIAALTCVCHGTFGRGRQNSSFCPRRVTKDQLPNLDRLASVKYGKIPCTMYVSDISLAMQMNDFLLDKFGNVDNWIKSLHNNGHYS